MNLNPRHAALALAALCGAFILAGGISSCSSPTSAGGPGEGWTEDLDEATARAKKTGRPILLDFTGSDWCGWCIKLHKEVFDTDEFNSYAAENLVLVTIDFPNRRKMPADITRRNKQLQSKYDVKGYPTIVILDPSGEKVLGRTGYVPGGPAAFIAEVEKITGK